ncbi:MAG: aldo/keto reductase [Chloroflexi bacterium]|nr:aldo/keto reductase [Chloroflexota bacterium]
MQYTTLGKTGYRVSRLGFGAMRLPMVGEGEAARVNRELAIPMIHRAFEGGVTYIDTAVGYCNGDSQRAVGEALKGWRDKIVVSTKNHEYKDEKTWWTNLENSLERLQISYIDIYNHHGLNWERFTTDARDTVSTWMRRAKDQGLIKHICFSFHDSNENLIKLIDYGYGDSITLQYNMLDRSLEEGIAYAREKGVGVVVMGPVAGGRLGTNSEVLEELLPQVKRVPELALRFVLSNANVGVALSGMSTMQQVEENLATASDPVALTDDDRAVIDEHLVRLKELANLYCTGCGYCMPCPNEVNIPHVFRLYNEAKVYGLWEVARKAYDEWRGVSGKRADACLECGECEQKCPQNIEIIRQLAEADEALTR